VDEDKMRAVHAAYARLRSDPEAWDGYRGELADWDLVAGDGLSSPGDEYPEYNQ
jgi:hypothetical protein